MFCNKCGAKLDDDAMFCPACGAKVRQAAEEMGPVVQNAEPAAQSNVREASIPIAEESGDSKEIKKKKPVALIAGIAVAVVLVAAVFVAAVGIFFVSRLGAGSNVKVDSRAECNVNNGAHFAYDDSNFYFVGLYNDNDEETSVYSTTYNGTNKKLLSDDENISWIRLCEGKLVYVAHRDNIYEFGMMDTDGSNKSVIKELDKTSDTSLQKYDFVKNKLYYIYSDDLYVYDMSDENTDVIAKGVDSFAIAGKYVYFCADGKISSYHMKSGEITEICKADVKYMVYDDGKIYFNNDKGIYYVPVTEEGPVTRVVNDSAVSRFLIDNDTIFYIQTLETDDIISLAKYMGDDSDYYGYAIMMIGVGQLHKVDKTGGSAEYVDSDQILLYTLYGQPNGLYCEISLFSNQAVPVELE